MFAAGPPQPATRIAEPSGVNRALKGAPHFLSPSVTLTKRFEEIQTEQKAESPSPAAKQAAGCGNFNTNERGSEFTYVTATELPSPKTLTPGGLSRLRYSHTLRVQQENEDDGEGKGRPARTAAALNLGPDWPRETNSAPLFRAPPFHPRLDARTGGATSPLLQYMVSKKPERWHPRAEHRLPCKAGEELLCLGEKKSRISTK